MFQVIAEFTFRFLTHQLLMVVMPQIIVQWFSVCCLSAILLSVNSQRSFVTNSCLLVMMIPIHFVYIALIVLSIVPNQVTSATCANDLIYPYTMMASDALFLLVQLICLSMQCAGFCLRLKPKGDFTSEHDYELHLKCKTLFE